MARRSQSLQTMVEKCNKYFEDSPNSEGETRKQLASILSSLLMEVGCYRGFSYLYWATQGFLEWEKAGCPGESPETFHLKEPYIYGPTGDKTRVRYN